MITLHVVSHSEEPFLFRAAWAFHNLIAIYRDRAGRKMSALSQLCALILHPFFLDKSGGVIYYKFIFMYRCQ